MADQSDMLAFQIAQTLPMERRAEFQMAYMSQKKNATTAFLLGLFLGFYGADRFYVGDIVLGFAKIFTCGGLGFWYLLDLFLIWGAVEQHNRHVVYELQAMYRPDPAPPVGRPSGQF